MAPADGSSSPAKGRAALTVAAAAAENTKKTMSTGTTNLLTAAMIPSFSLSLFSGFSHLGYLYNAQAAVCFDTLIAGPTNTLYI